MSGIIEADQLVSHPECFAVKPLFVSIRLDKGIERHLRAFSFTHEL